MNTNTIPEAPVRRGRKPVMVTWPESEFTAKEVSAKLGADLSRVSVHSKINAAVKKGELVLVKVSKAKMGRPHSIYKKAP